MSARVALVAGECAVCPGVIEPGEAVVFFGGNDVRHCVCPEDRAERAEATRNLPRVSSPAEFNGECVPPPGCTCLGHQMAGVRHIVPCCDEPHIDQAGGSVLRPGNNVTPTADADA